MKQRNWLRWTRAGAALLAATALALTTVMSASAQVPVGPAGSRPEVVDDELLVKFKPGTPAASQAAAHQQASGRVVRDIPGLDVQVVQVSRGQAQQRLPAYVHNPNVAYAELNGIAYPSWAPTDGLYPQQWALNNGPSDIDIDAPQAWSVTTGAAASTIAIVDTGIRADHPDLAGKIVESRNWFESSPDTGDGYGHGTHVAGIAAARPNNDTASVQTIVGVCPDCTLLNAKVCDNFGGCPYDRIANGILWSVGCELRDAFENCLSPVRAKSINVSLAGTYNSIALQSAVDKAWNRGAVLACAAGNAGTNTRHYPAAYVNCIATAATDQADHKASWSNYGNGWVDVAAPGVNILSSVNSGGYEAWNGTSMASPHVAGLAGLLVAQGRSRDQVRSQIESKTDRISGGGSYWSKGRINACRAVGVTGC
jgi:thermitase